MDVRSFSSSAELARAAAEFLWSRMRETIAERGRCTLLLAGGSTPAEMYRFLARMGQQEGAGSWGAVRLYWGDERCVAPDDAQSNYRLVRETLLRDGSVPADQIYRMSAELGGLAAAEQYEALLRQHFPDEDGFTFDLTLLGLGEDGHTASLFPRTVALSEAKRWAVPNTAPVAPFARVTLTAPCINRSRAILFLVSGAKKTTALRKLLSPTGDALETPARLIRAIEGETLVFVDEAALGSA